MDNRIVESNCEVAMLLSENEDLQLEMSRIEVALADAERRAECRSEVSQPLVVVAEGTDGSRTSPRMRQLTWDAFTDRHDKLARALKRSFTTEAQLLRSCRSVKDNLVIKSVQLRTALHQKTIDNEIIMYVRAQANRSAIEAGVSAETERATVAAPRRGPRAKVPLLRMISLRQ